MIKSMSTLEIYLNSDNSFKNNDRNAYSDNKVNDYKDEYKKEEDFNNLFDDYFDNIDKSNEYFYQIDSSENENKKDYSIKNELDMNCKYLSDNKIFKINNDKSGKNIKSFKNSFYLCPKCQIIPLIDFINYKTIKIKCYCNKERESIIKMDSFFKKYEKKFKKENKKIDFINRYIKCKDHNKKFKYHCEDCNKDLCKNCLLLTKTHKKHNITIFDFLIFYFNIRKKTILNKIYDNKDKKLLNPKFKDFYKIFKIIESNSSKYHTYNIFRTVENLYNYLLFNLDKVDSNNAQIKEIKIRQIKEINNINNLHLITSIIISKQNINNLEKICKADLVNLDILELPNNEINDLTLLKNAKFLNLKHLNLSNNKIDNKNISYFTDFNFKYLSHINLSLNLITDFKFFDTLKNFPNLSHLLIRSNKFKIKDNDFNYEYDLSSLERLVISDGVMSDDSIEILSKMKLCNLKILHLNNNKLSSLSSIKEIESEKLEEIYINNNELETFEELVKFKTLTKIEIRNNKINNFNNFEDFFYKLPELKKINLKGNRINNKDERNSEKLISLKEKFKDIKITI